MKLELLSKHLASTAKMTDMKILVTVTEHSKCQF